MTASNGGYASEQARIREGSLRGAALCSWLAAHAPADRDLAIERLLGIAQPPPPNGGLDDDLVDYIPSGIAPIVRAVLEVPIAPSDIFVDLGAGLGKVAMVVHLLTGARTRGIELQPELALRASAAAADLVLSGVSFERSDARDADVSDASVVFLYLPFTGRALSMVMHRLHAAAQHRAIVICTLGLDLRAFEWLAVRESEEFWLSIYDARLPPAIPRPPCAAPSLGPAAEDVASERATRAAVQNAMP